MKIVNTENLESVAIRWDHGTEGEVYRSVEFPGMLALKVENRHAVCLRAGPSTPTNRIWIPGPPSMWVHVPAQLHIPEGV